MLMSGISQLVLAQVAFDSRKRVAPLHWEVGGNESLPRKRRRDYPRFMSRSSGDSSDRRVCLSQISEAVSYLFPVIN